MAKCYYVNLTESSNLCNPEPKNKATVWTKKCKYNQKQH